MGADACVLTKEGRVTYFVGSDNYFSHAEGDESSRRFALASLMENGHVRARDLEQAPWCIPHRTLMNWTGQLRERGAGSFYRLPSPHRPRVMDARKVAQCAALLGEGKSVAQVAREVGIEESTLRKAVKRQAIPPIAIEAGNERSAEGVVMAPQAGVERERPASSTKTERSREDAEAAAGMGTACIRAEERVAAAMGVVSCATTRFEPCNDVPMGGLLASLPALCANGLLSGMGKYLNLPAGFYSGVHILLTMGFMALGRIRRPEGLRHIPPGEFGKLIGLDRVPEVRTLREKITLMAQGGDPKGWMEFLSQQWMDDDPQEAGYLYVDGHVRVYHGHTANLPRRYVSRQKLCLRGTTDYWVNDALGRPFFVVSKPVTQGLEEALLNDIVPELLRSVPGQPSAQALEEDPLLHRFVIVFDREGATHSLIGKLWEQRIGVITYRKNVKDTWPEEEFAEHEVPVPGGGTSRMKLTTRQTVLSAGKAGLPVAEVRRLTDTGHQTAVICSARRLDMTVIAGRMFTRWCQENYFAYMMKHFDIDGLIEYGAKELPGTLLVINPVWRELDKAAKKALRGVRALQATLGKLSGEDGASVQKKAECLQDIQIAEQELNRLRADRKAASKKVTIDSLPQELRPTQLLPLNKTLADAVKMIAYRAETALVAILRRHLNKEEEARALIRELMISAANIEPDETANTLTVRIHRMANPVHDQTIAALLEELTQCEFSHPETRAKMIFSLV